MKPSLEDERRALLEHIEASRAVYRRMLSEASSLRSERHVLHPLNSLRHTNIKPGDLAIAWMKAHPLWVAGGVALVVLLMPRLKIIGHRFMNDISSPKHKPPPRNTLRTLLTVTALLLRDPSRVGTAIRMMKSAWQWMQRHRTA